MKFSLGVAAMLAVGAFSVVGCNGEGAKNEPAPTPTSTNVEANKPSEPTANNAQPAAEANNAPVAANNAPAANNEPATADAQKDKAAQKAAEELKKQMSQVKLEEPSGMGKDGWKKLAKDPKAITQAVEAKLKTLKNMKMSMVMMAETPVGKGMVNADNLIGDQTRFRLEYADFQTRPQPHFESSLVAKTPDNKFSTFTNSEYKPGRIAPNSDVLKGWALDTTHYLGSWIGTDKKPLTELISAAQKAKWKIGVEEKTFGTNVFQRIILESSTKPTKRFELLIDPKLMLPTTFNAVVYDKKLTKSGLEIAWGQSTKPFTDQDLAPKVKTDPVKVITEEQAAKMKGLKKVG